MSSGGSTFSHLKYLHSGLQESAQRQVNEFDERVQVHFDWLTTFKGQLEPKTAVPSTPATGKTKQLPQITPLKGFNYQPSSARPALALIDTNSINSFETPRGKRLAARNAAKRESIKPEVATLQIVEPVSHEIAPTADPVSDEVLNCLDSAPVRKGRSKREFKRTVEKAVEAEEVDSCKMEVTSLESLVAPVVDLEAIESPLQATTEAVSIQESEVVLVLDAKEGEEVTLEVSQTNSGVSGVDEEKVVEEEDAMNVDDIVVPNANNEVAEAMASRRQARRGRTTKAKKTDAIMPSVDQETPSAEETPRLSLSDMDFSALDGAIMEVFSPRGKNETSEPSRRRGRPARGKAASSEEPVAPVVAKRTTRATRAKNTRATRATKKIEADEVETQPAEVTEVTEEEEEALAQENLHDEMIEVDSKVNLKKRSREPSLESGVAKDAVLAPSSPSQGQLKVNEEICEQEEPSPKRKCSNEFETPSDAALTASSSETAASPISNPSPQTDETSHMAVDSLSNSQSSNPSLSLAFEMAEAEAYSDLPSAKSTTEEPEIVATESLHEHTDAMETDLLYSSLPAEQYISIPSASSESDASVTEVVNEAASSVIKKHTIEKRASEMIPASHVISTIPPLSRASTNAANPLTSKMTVGTLNAASASRLNEKIARIQENKAELEAKRRSELEAKQKLEKEKTTDRIRERLDLVRKRTATNSSRNLTPSVQPNHSMVKPESSPKRTTSVIEPTLDVQPLLNLPEKEQLRPKTVAELVMSPERPKPKLKLSIGGNEVLKDGPWRESISSSPTTPTKMSIDEMVEKFSVSAPVVVSVVEEDAQTPPSSPARLVVPPSLAAGSAMSLKKSTPRRFLHGLMTKEKTPAKRTPASAHANGAFAPTSNSKRLNSPFLAMVDAEVAAMEREKAILASPIPAIASKSSPDADQNQVASDNKKPGFWGNLFGLLGAKKTIDDSSAQSRLVSDSPLFSPTISRPTKAPIAVLPTPDFGSPQSSLLPNKSKARIEASWSPLPSSIAPTTAKPQENLQNVTKALQAPNGSSAMTISGLDSDDDLEISVDESLLMPPPMGLSQKAYDNYSAGVRNVPMLDSASEDEDDEDIALYGEDDHSETSLDEMLGRLVPEEEMFQVVSGSGTANAQQSVTTMKILSPMMKPSISVPVFPTAKIMNQGVPQLSLDSAVMTKGGVSPKTPEKDPAERNPFFDTPEMQVVPDTPKKRSLGLDDDEEDDPTGAVWTRSRYLLPILEMQAAIDPDDIFGTDFPATCDLGEIFSEVKVRIMARPRTSSGLWTRDKLTIDEKKEYKRRMGYAIQTLRKEERR